MQPARSAMKHNAGIFAAGSSATDDDIYDFPTSRETTPTSPAEGATQASARRNNDAGKKRKHSSAFSGASVLRRTQPSRPQPKPSSGSEVTSKRILSTTPSLPKDTQRETLPSSGMLLPAAPIRDTKTVDVLETSKSTLLDIPKLVTPAPRRQRLIDTLAAQRAESPGSDRNSDSESISGSETDISKMRTVYNPEEAPSNSPSPRVRLGVARTPDRRPGPTKSRKIKLTYSSSRSFLSTSQGQNNTAIFDGDGGSVLPAPSDQDPFAAPLSPRTADYDFEDDVDGPKVGIQSVHELRRAGANNRFSDEMDDLLSRIGKPSATPSSLRRNALCELANKLQRKDFASQFRDHAARDNVVKAIGSEEDIISGLALTAALVTFLSFSPAPHLLRQLTTERIGKLLSRLFQCQRDIFDISSDKDMNVSRITKSSLETLKISMLQMDIWHGEKPASLTPRTLALQLLVILSRFAEIQSLEHLTGDIELDVVMMARTYSKQRPPRNVDYVLIILALEAQSNLISLESEQYVSAIKGCLQATLDTWLQQNNVLDNTTLKLAINITNSETGASVFDDGPLLSKLVASISEGFSRIQNTLQKGNFQNKLYDELLLILGILINILEHCPLARTSIDQGSLDIATALWLGNMSFVNNADSVSKSKIGVALGYLAIVLGYLYLTASGRSQMQRRQDWPGTAHLVGSIEEFLRISKTIGNKTHELETLVSDLQAQQASVA